MGIFDKIRPEADQQAGQFGHQGDQGMRTAQQDAGQQDAGQQGGNPVQDQYQDPDSQYDQDPSQQSGYDPDQGQDPCDRESSRGDFEQDPDSQYDRDPGRQQEGFARQGGYAQEQDPCDQDQGNC